ncbi:MAG: copper-containing nitrite reductase [Anaerolineales bacterium]
MKKLIILLGILLTSIALSACIQSNTSVVNTEYVLTTDMREGKFVFLGVNKDINGIVNPALRAEPGEQISVTLINGGHGEHDIVFPQLNVHSDTIGQLGETTTVRFAVPDENDFFTYYDSSHEQLGMSGVLLVGDVVPPTSEETETNQQVAVSRSGSNNSVVEYTLVSGVENGKMVFVGRGGSIDGVANPDLTAEVGELVRVTMVSGEGATHNFVVDAFNARTDDVTGKENSAVVEFTPDKEGTFAYFCDVPGHRLAGMVGKFIVGSGMAESGSATVQNVQAADTSAIPSAGPMDENAVDITRDPTDLPGPVVNRGPETVQVELDTIELSGQLADGTTFKYWTFNGQVPGPFIRVRVGDTVEVTLKNLPNSMMSHSVDFHAVTGPGGGSVATQTEPGGTTTFTFKALKPGLFVYHCATPVVAQHISNGMYGMILVEPEGGLPPVDREFYVMQGELYTAQSFGTTGNLTEDTTKLLNEDPEYFVFNGASMALTTDEHALMAKVGETVRIFFGVGGPNFTSSFHVIGEIFDHVYNLASLTTPPMTDVQTTLVPPGGATMVEIKLEVPGRYILVDHALSRLQRGLAGYLYAEGEQAPDIFNWDSTGDSGN